MFKRSVAAIGQWLFPGQAARKARAVQGDDVRVARRGFFKKSAIGAVSVASTAGLAKVVVDSASQPDLKSRYGKDHAAGERELVEREYVLMSKQEKAEMIQRFIDNNSDQD